MINTLVFVDSIPLEFNILDKLKNITPFNILILADFLISKLTYYYNIVVKFQLY